MKLSSYILITLLCCIHFSCSRKAYQPAKKYAPQALQADFDLARKILEQKHPSLYWYTSKDSMDFYFGYYRSKLKDSMNEYQFQWQVLAPMIHQIHCGHTSVFQSKAFEKYASNKEFPSFPLYLKCWKDTMMVLANLNINDSIFKKGTILKTINGKSAETLMSEMNSYLPEDGYAHNVNYIRISSRFPVLHRSIYGLSDHYEVEYLDTSGRLAKANLPLYLPKKKIEKSIRKDSSNTKNKVISPGKNKVNKLLFKRSLSIDSSGSFATMKLNTFSPARLHHFFRQSFRELNRKKTASLIIDLRSNGGGAISNYLALTRYLTDHPFKVSDSCFSKVNHLSPFIGKFYAGPVYDLQYKFLSRRQKDKDYHIRTYEQKWHHPRKRNHYNGQVYLLTSGPTFSASTLFINTLKGQKNVVVAGEETGGGWYGNNGVIIPTFRLPNSKLRIRMPLYRIVQFNHVEKNGSGIIPDLLIPTDCEAIKNGRDKKMEVIKSLIQQGVEP